MANQHLSAYVRDIIAVETELHEAFGHQQRDQRLNSFPAARILVGNIEATIDMHLGALRNTLERRGDGESALKTVFGSVLGMAAGVYDKLRPEDPVSRMLRDDYAALSFAVICYEMLHATALGAQDDEIAELALEHLRHYTPFVMAISSQMPHVIVEELDREGKLVANHSAAEQAARNTHEAWTSSSPG